MEFYVLSIILSIILNFISKLRLKKYIESDMNNIIYCDIGKYELRSVKELIKGIISSLIMILLPGINLLFSGLEFYGSTRDDVLEKVASKRVWDFASKRYLKMYEQQQELEDSLKLNGLTEEQIADNIKLAYEENETKVINKKIYKDMKASEEAVIFLKELENNGDITLSARERIKLLKEYRKAFVSDSKETLKPIQKTLNISRK